MKIAGLDLGTRTLGIAISDKTKTIATFYASIRFDEKEYESALTYLEKFLKEQPIETFVLGLPKNMNNSVGESAKRTLQFKQKLEERFSIPVIMQDERLSTVEATYYLLESNLSRKRRKTKVDGVAATIILQTYLDKRKAGNNGRENDI